MGQPDLKDTIADPSHPGTTVPRYVWLETGRVAIFGNDGRVSSIQSIEPAAKQQARAEAAATPERPFDPVQTPLDYAFFPLKAAIIYAGAGLQCVVGGPCSKPRLPYPAS
ncbi:MAG TPA: hypothetical protein VGR40_08025 [Candidatus Binatus sp.]|nr:hypothetical protein [Candidatus Binatus sp.]